MSRPRPTFATNIRSLSAAAPEPAHLTAVAAARQRWPEVTVDAAAFAAALAGAGVTPAAADLAARGADLVLAHATAAGQAPAATVFERDIMSRARATIARYVRDAARVDEVVQQLRIQLMVAAPGMTRPRLARFDGRAPLGAWVCMCAARQALRAMRDERSRHEVAFEWSDALAELTATDDVVEPLRARYADAVAAALRDACAALPRRHRAVIRLLFVEDAAVDDVATIYQVHRVTVWRWVQEAQEQLRDSIRAQLRQAVPSSDVGSATLIGWVEGQVMLSLDQALSVTATDVR